MKNKRIFIIIILIFIGAMFWIWAEKNTQKERTLNELSEILGKAFDEVWELSQKEEIKFKQAAYLSAIGRVVKAMKD